MILSLTSAETRFYCDIGAWSNGTAGRYKTSRGRINHRNVGGKVGAIDVVQGRPQTEIQ